MKKLSIEHLQLFILAVLFVGTIICYSLLPGCSKTDPTIPSTSISEKKIFYPGIKSITDKGLFIQIEFIKLYNHKTGESFSNGTAKFYPKSVNGMDIDMIYCPTQCSYNQDFTAITMQSGFVKINGVIHNGTTWDATN